MTDYNEKELEKLAEKEGEVVLGWLGVIFLLDLLLLMISPFFWLFGSFFLFMKVVLFSVIFGPILCLGYWFLREVYKSIIKDRLNETENN